MPASAKTVHRAGGTGKKKNKVYVDDAESMMTILAIVNAEKEGQIESKVAKERQMEEIREARRKEAEKKEGRRRKKLEQLKEEIKEDDNVKKKRNKKLRTEVRDGGKHSKEVDRVAGIENGVKTKKRKSVSFA